MTKTLIAAAVLAVVVVPAAAEATKVPQQFLGSWCSANVAEEDIYKRSGVCNAHEPEEHLTFTADRLMISDLFNCKFLEITTINRRNAHLLKFWCKSTQGYGEPWISELWVSAFGRNKLAITFQPQ